MEKDINPANQETCDYYTGTHYWNMDSVRDWFKETLADDSIVNVVCKMDEIYGYSIDSSTFTFAAGLNHELGRNINSRWTDEDVLTALRNVGILSEDYAMASEIRNEVPGNWSITMNEETGETHGYLTLQCLNAYGAMDKDHIPTNGKGCTINRCVDTGSISEDNDGVIVMNANLTICYIPYSEGVNLEHYCDVYTYADEEKYGRQLKDDGGWIIWIWEVNQDMVTDKYGDSGFYTSGSYHYGTKSNEYAWTSVAGVKVEKNVEGND